MTNREDVVRTLLRAPEDLLRRYNRRATRQRTRWELYRWAEQQGICPCAAEVDEALLRQRWLARYNERRVTPVRTSSTLEVRQSVGHPLEDPPEPLTIRDGLDSLAASNHSFGRAPAREAAAHPKESS